jgi:hypothetical protein
MGAASGCLLKAAPRVSSLFSTLLTRILSCYDDIPETEVAHKIRNESALGRLTIADSERVGEGNLSESRLPSASGFALVA